jgi:hypothetical protein
MAATADERLDDLFEALSAAAEAQQHKKAIKAADDSER